MKISEIRQQFPQYSDIPDEQLVIGIHRKFYSDMPFRDFHSKIQYDKAPDPTEGMSGLSKFGAAYGSAVPNAWRGVKQVAGIGDQQELQAEIDEQKKLQAPLMNTGAGIAGSIAGNAAMLAPSVAIPGANTYTGATLIGAGIGAMQPVETGGSRVANTAIGGGAGFVGQAAGNALGRAIRPVASRLSPEEQLLAEAAKREGIPLTAGQKTGSRPLQIVESVMENLPLTSEKQLAGREAQQRAFTAAALRRAGMTGDVADAGSLVAKKSSLGGRLGDIAKRGTLSFSQGLDDRLDEIAADAGRHLPPSVAENVTGTISKIKQQAAHQSSLVGAMSGDSYQGWREPLRGLASNTETGQYFQQIRKALDDAFRSQLGGAEAEAFKGTSRQYANLKTIIDAMGGPGNLPAKGQVAPAQLGAALGRSMGREGRALGRGDLNELSRVGQTFVREQIPNAGTPQRQLAQGLLTAGAGSGTGAGIAGITGEDPWKGAAYGAGIGATSLLAPKVAQSLMNSGAGQRYLTQGVVPLTEAHRAAIAAALRTGAIGTVPMLEGQ